MIQQEGATITKTEGTFVFSLPRFRVHTAETNTEAMLNTTSTQGRIIRDGEEVYLSVTMLREFFGIDVEVQK